MTAWFIFVRWLKHLISLLISVFVKYSKYLRLFMSIIKSLLINLIFKIMAKQSISPSTGELIDALNQSKQSKIFAAKMLSKWFEIDITIKIFGVTVFSWHFPPVEKQADDK